MKVIIVKNGKEKELEVSETLKNKIDRMTHFQMGYSHRFAPSGDPLHQGDAGIYFQHVFQKLGGFNPLLSKELGWDN